MFSVFDYLRQLVRDSFLAGVQDAFEIMDQGDHRESIKAAAREFVNRSAPSLPSPDRVPDPAPAAQPSPRASEAKPSPVTPPTPADLVPQSLPLPTQEIPRIDGYQNYDRRKKGPGRPPKHPHQGA